MLSNLQVTAAAHCPYLSYLSENVISVFLPPAGALQLNQESEAAVDAVSYPVLTSCQFIHLFPAV